MQKWVCDGADSVSRMFVEMFFSVFLCYDLQLLAASFLILMYLLILFPLVKGNTGCLGITRIGLCVSVSGGIESQICSPLLFHLPNVWFGCDIVIGGPLAWVLVTFLLPPWIFSGQSLKQLKFQFPLLQNDRDWFW